MSDYQKQTVQWFPGHMAKTRRLIKESLPFVDLVTEIVDARIPMSSSNPELKEMIGNKPRIVLLNKCDVADEKATAKWVEYYKNNGMYALPVDCRSGKGLNAYLPLVREVLKDKIQRNTEKGMVINVKIALMSETVVPEVTLQVQSVVKSQIESVVGLIVNAVPVMVDNSIVANN